MSDRTSSLKEVLGDLSTMRHRVFAMLTVAQYAVDAQRVLEEIDAVSSTNPELHAALTKHVEAYRNPDFDGDMQGALVYLLSIARKELDRACEAVEPFQIGNRRTA